MRTRSGGRGLLGEPGEVVAVGIEVEVAVVEFAASDLDEEGAAKELGDHIGHCRRQCKSGVKRPPGRRRATPWGWAAGLRWVSLGRSSRLN